jgi:hypothetical protein
MLEANLAVNLKAQTIEQHVTQGGFTPITVRSRNDGHISAFVHRDEFFYRFRASASSPALDGGARPPPVDAGVDSGTRDSGTPPVDSGTDSGGGSGVDSGSALDSGTVDGGASDAGSLDSAAAGDGGASIGSGADAGAEVADAASTDAHQAGQDGEAGGGVTPDAEASSWPGEDELDEDTDDIVTGDPGDTKRSKDSGCSLTATGSSAESELGLLLLGALSALLIHRRARAATRTPTRRA